MTKPEDCTTLSYETPDGLFKCNDDGPLYWVFGSDSEDRYAVQLTKSATMPVFGYISLADDAAATGRWICDVRLKIRRKPEDSIPGICGIISHRNRRLSLRVNREHGGSSDLVISGYDLPSQSYRSYYLDWELISKTPNAGGTMFVSPTRLAALRPYGVQPDIYHVEWC